MYPNTEVQVTTKLSTVTEWHAIDGSTDQQGRTKNPEVGPHIYCKLISDKQANILGWRSDFLMNIVGKARYSQVEE